MPCEVVASTGYELLDRARWEQQNTACRCSADEWNRNGMGRVHHTMMRALTDRRSRPASQKCDVPVVGRAGQHDHHTLSQSRRDAQSLRRC